MASYQSLSAQFNPVQPPMDVDFMGKVLMAKEGQTNANIAQIDETLGQLKIQENMLIGDQRKARFANNVQTLLDEVNKSGKLNLQSGDFTRRMKNYVTTALDDYTLDHIAKANNIRAFQADVAEKKKKGDGSYNDVNYAYSAYKGGLQEYVNEQTDELGNLSYVPNVSWQKELKDLSENIEKYDTEIKKTWTENGYIYTREGKVMSADKLKNIAQTFLTDGAKKQMTVDGWASIHQGNTEEERVSNTKTAFNDFKIRTLDAEKENVLLAKAEAAKTGSETDKKNAEIAQENYDNLEKGLNNIYENGSAEQMYGTIYKESTLNSFANTFKYNTVDITDIKGDTTYMAKVKMDYDMQRDAVKDAQWKADYDLKSIEVNGGAQGTFQTKADFGAEVPEAGNVQQKAFEEIDGLDNVINSKVNELYNTLDEDTQKAIDLEVKNSKGLKNKEDVLIEYAQGGKISHADADALNTLIVDRFSKQEEYQKYKKEAEKEAEASLDTPQLVERLYNNPNIKIMWKGNDGKERMYSAKEVLVNNGIVDSQGKKLKNLKDNKAVFEGIKKSMLADKALSAKQVYDYKNYISQLANSLGENIKDIIVKGETQYTQGSGMGQYMGAIATSETLNPNSKTAKFIAEHKKRGGYNRAGIFSEDDSFDDIPEADSYFQKTDPSKINLRIGEKIMANAKTSFGLVTTVRPGTPEYADIAQQVGFDLKGNLPIELKKIPDQPNMISVSLGAGSATKIKPTEIPNEQKLRIEDLSQRVLSQVNLYNTKPKITLENFPPVKQKATYSDMKGVTLAGFAKQYYGGTDKNSVYLASLTTKEGASNFYFSQFADKLGTEDKPTLLGKTIKNIINSPDTYVEAQKTINADGIFILPVIVKGDTTVFTPNPTTEEGLINENNTDIAYKNMKFNPQKYVNEYLISVLKSNNQNQIDKLTKIYGE